MEKEIIRLKSEVDRLKTRQSYIDTVYSELKEFVSSREKRAGILLISLLFILFVLYIVGVLIR